MKQAIAFVLSFITSVALGHLPACSSPGTRIENAAAVAQYERLLDACKEEGKRSRDYQVYARCADEVDARLCRESGVRCVDGGAR